MSRSYRHGGHTSLYKFDRKYTIRKVRRASRDFCNKVKIDLEFDREFGLERQPDSNFDCGRGWNPLRRWIDSHVDEKWDNVYSKISTKIKNVLGKDEFVKEFIRSIVDLNPSESDKVTTFKHEFYVDDSGFLKKKNHIDMYKYNGRVNTKKITEFLNGRIIGTYNGKYYWFVPTKQGEYKCSWYNSYDEIYNYPWNNRFLRYLKKDYVLSDDGFNKKWKWDWVDIAGYGETVNTRKLKPLSDSEIDWFESLPNYYKNEILKWSPSNCE